MIQTLLLKSHQPMFKQDRNIVAWWKEIGAVGRTELTEKKLRLQTPAKLGQLQNKFAVELGGDIFDVPARATLALASLDDYLSQRAPDEQAIRKKNKYTLEQLRKLNSRTKNSIVIVFENMPWTGACTRILDEIEDSRSKLIGRIVRENNLGYFQVEELKKILKEVLPESSGVIVRTAAEGATEDQLTRDVQRLTAQWEHINRQVETTGAPALLHSEPDLLVKIVKRVAFTEIPPKVM